jgi:hypothetical protein
MFPAVADGVYSDITRAEITLCVLQPTSKRARTMKGGLALRWPPRSPRSWQRVDRNVTNTLCITDLLSLWSR